ncbi:MAG: hypothetical protein HC915_17690 [Anaerolineae bacterium]|nr:hypothetical protein [Anaerolineae bacterium]
MIASLALPLGAALCGLVATVKLLNGDDFRYPWLADWLDRTFGAITPAIQLPRV